MKQAELLSSFIALGIKLKQEKYSIVTGPDMKILYPLVLSRPFGNKGSCDG